MVDRLRSGVSVSRLRQLRWVVGELERALDCGEMPAAAGASLAWLLAPDAVEAYWGLAAAGRLRRVAVARPERVSAASMDTRRQCLEILGRAVGVAVVVPAWEPPVLAETVPPGQQRELFRRLARMAALAPQSALRARLLAVVGVVLDTGARVGELCAMTVDDLSEDLDSVVVRRRPQSQRVNPAPVERVELSQASGVALRHWLLARRGLVAGLEGDPVRALWVSVVPHHDGAVGGGYVVRPPGMPLRPVGLARAYTRGVVALNGEMAGRGGWTPLPTRLEPLRRAVELEDASRDESGSDG